MSPRQSAKRIRALPLGLLLLVIRGYQLLLSPLMGTRCRFYPCCSNYAIEALRQHGCRRGSWLAMKRIARCNPYSAGGHDPVPHPPTFNQK
ncbi:MAG: membrane protein insertion efficiency factor YidD [Pseudohongiellaceae bacterium]